ncbi:serine hydrolase [Leptobacterium flavescens]|uniref:Serine hydrolase n=1 Tax=Leptobacterium flavescens TaxID=472055 RepID=A0A6P0UI20_9FLAO|nr:serine hydrolase [Leptobacterium flavescens]NER12100.1 serine hydrolase [Leptobacterium flavescens]
MNTFQKSKIILIGLFFLTTVAKSQTINEKIDEVMQRYTKLDQFSGTVLLAKDGEILYSKAFGDANKSFGIKNKVDTKFNIASMGKMFTGVAIFQLQERGKLDINAPVIKYLKNFPLGDKITIYHLLSHTSGLGSYMRHPDYRADRNAFKKIDDLLPLIYEEELQFDTPGERFSYSNSGMIILGAIIEKLTGQSYSDYITKNIFEPAKMYDTEMRCGDEVVQNRATGYMRSISGKFHNNYSKSSPPSSDGGILSTIGDILKFDQALYSSILINNTSKEKMFTALKVTYGLAFQVEERQGNKVVGHSGGAPGISTYFSRYLKDKYTIIVLSNYDRIARNVAHYIEYIVYGKKYKLPRPTFNQFVYANMDNIDTLGTLEDINDFIKKDYSINHPQYLNIAAYEFMNEGEVHFAIKLFKLNVQLFSKEANVYDSLGEAYEKNEQYDLALKNYEKAVEVATEHSHRSLNSFKATLERFKEKVNVIKTIK